MVNDINLPRIGTFLGRARSPGNSHPLVVTVRGGDIVDITSKQAPTVRDICEMDDPAGYVGGATAKPSVRSRPSRRTASKRAVLQPNRFCCRRSICRR